jgi:hypothetical protein
MLTTRNFVATALIIATLSILSACWSLLQPRDGGGLRSDSFGIYHAGHRALYDTFAELDIPVHRSTDPPDVSTLSDSLLVLWAPNLDLIETEPRWLKNLGSWVADGGELLVAFDGTPKESLEDLMLREVRKLSSDWENDEGESSDLVKSARRERVSQGHGDEIFRLLGLKSVSVRPVSKGDSADEIAGEEEPGITTSGRVPVEETLTEVDSGQPVQFRSYGIQSSGLFAVVPGDGRLIELPEDRFSVVYYGSGQPSDAIYLQSDPESESVETNSRNCIAARFCVGNGWVTVVSTPQLISNSRIGVADHLAVISALLLNTGRKIVFDEFYHGATIRGNPIWLMTRRPYSLTGIALVVLAATILWRSAVFLGPPLNSLAPSRRSLSEYLEAMTAFRRSTRNHALWTLHQVTDGLLWRLRREYGFPADQKGNEALLTAVHRNEPEKADCLKKVLSEIDQLSNSSRAVNERQTGPLIQRMTECLSKTVIKRSVMKSRK